MITLSQGSIVTDAEKFCMLTATAAPPMLSLGLPISPTREFTLEVNGSCAGIVASFRQVERSVLSTDSRPPCHNAVFNRNYEDAATFAM